MAPVVKAKPQAVRSPRVLVVDDEPVMLETIHDIASPRLNCRVSTAMSVAEARKALVVQSFDLLLVDIHLPDGDGMSLIELFKKHNPTGSAVIITGDASADHAITALRHGAADFLPKPFDGDLLLDRMRRALNTRGLLEKQNARIDRLREAVRRLNTARKTVSKKVDLLCNDLISAYGELSKQLDLVRVQENFRNCLTQSKDLEQMLCHAMDWMLRQIGYSNVAIWLATETGQLQLGAYMKYTIAGEDHITDALLQAVVPAIVEEGFLRAKSEEIQDELPPQASDELAGLGFIGVNCTYLGENLATLLFFRDEAAPFTDEDASVLQSIASIFAVSLATMVKDHEAGAEGDEEPSDRADADWWKRGEDSPY
jgi:YesN/AraC family two-component response regulator